MSNTDDAASRRVRVLGIGKDPDMEKQREDAYYTLQGRIEQKRLRAEFRNEVWRNRSDGIREQCDKWSDWLTGNWPFALAMTGFSFVAMFISWLASKVVIWIFTMVTGSMGGIIGPGVTGYSIESDWHEILLYYHVEYKLPDKSDWYVYTPLLEPETAQIQLEQLQAQYPDREWRVKGSKRHGCWRVIRESRMTDPMPVSPCFTDYGDALVVLSAFQVSFESGAPVVVPDMVFMEEPRSLPTFDVVVDPAEQDMAVPPSPEVVVEKHYVPTEAAPETTVILVPATQDYWLPYRDDSTDVGPEILEGLVPDHVYYVLEE